MIAKERQRQIVGLLQSRKLVNAQALAEQFGVSIVTIRRDLDLLVEQGVARRIYGGAVLNGERDVQPAAGAGKAVFRGRAGVCRREKQAIALRASELVQDGQTIFLDCGTTTAALAELLRERSNLTVVTNSLAVMNLLVDCTGVSVYCVGGLLRGNEATMTGDIAQSVLRNFYLDCAFIGAAGVAFDGGMTEFYYDTVDLRRLAMERSRRVVLLADSSKFGVRTFAAVGELDSVDVIVTDAGVDREYEQGIRRMGIELMVAEAEPEAHGQAEAD